MMFLSVAGQQLSLDKLSKPCLCEINSNKHNEQTHSAHTNMDQPK